jgi:hypothetical protein
MNPRDVLIGIYAVKQFGADENTQIVTVPYEGQSVVKVVEPSPRSLWPTGRQRWTPIKTFDVRMDAYVIRDTVAFLGYSEEANVLVVGVSDARKAEQ